VEQFGPYRLEELIGRGGMGEVYRAVDTGKDRMVAVKRLIGPHADDPVFRQRFRRESQLAARISSPHIVPIHDFGEIDGQLFIDMALIRGSDLAHVIAENGPLPPRRAVELSRSSHRSPTRWMPRMPRVWCTATSSRRTCS
jgi:serine/threonine protein kinase